MNLDLKFYDFLLNIYARKIPGVPWYCATEIKDGANNINKTGPPSCFVMQSLACTRE